MYLVFPITSFPGNSLVLSADHFEDLMTLFSKSKLLFFFFFSIFIHYIVILKATTNSALRITMKIFYNGFPSDFCLFVCFWEKLTWGGGSTINTFEYLL